eukprot:364317-Chlamydomonas_euryale.AAC.4
MFDELQLQLRMRSVSGGRASPHPPPPPPPPRPHLPAPPASPGIIGGLAPAAVDRGSTACGCRSPQATPSLEALLLKLAEEPLGSSASPSVPRSGSVSWVYPTRSGKRLHVPTRLAAAAMASQYWHWRKEAAAADRQPMGIATAAARLSS